MCVAYGTVREDHGISFVLQGTIDSAGRQGVADKGGAAAVANILVPGSIDVHGDGLFSAYPGGSIAKNVMFPFAIELALSTTTTTNNPPTCTPHPFRAHPTHHINFEAVFNLAETKLSHPTLIKTLQTLVDKGDPPFVLEVRRGPDKVLLGFVPTSAGGLLAGLKNSDKVGRGVPYPLSEPNASNGEVHVKQRQQGSLLFDGVVRLWCRCSVFTSLFTEPFWQPTHAADAGSDGADGADGAAAAAGSLTTPSIDGGKGNRTAANTNQTPDQQQRPDHAQVHFKRSFLRVRFFSTAVVCTYVSWWCDARNILGIGAGGHALRTLLTTVLLLPATALHWHLPLLTTPTPTNGIARARTTQPINKVINVQNKQSLVRMLVAIGLAASAALTLPQLWPKLEQLSNSRDGVAEAWASALDYYPFWCLTTSAVKWVATGIAFVPSIAGFAASAAETSAHAPSAVAAIAAIPLKLDYWIGSVLFRFGYHISIVLPTLWWGGAARVLTYCGLYLDRVSPAMAAVASAGTRGVGANLWIQASSTGSLFQQVLGVVAGLGGGEHNLDMSATLVTILGLAVGTAAVSTTSLIDRSTNGTVLFSDRNLH
jgi:hypothetical protein